MRGSLARPVREFARLTMATSGAPPRRDVYRRLCRELKRDLRSLPAKRRAAARVRLEVMAALMRRKIAGAA